MKRPKPSMTKAPSNSVAFSGGCWMVSQAASASSHHGQPADRLGLAVGLGAEHAEHQQRHGADHEHDLG